MTKLVGPSHSWDNQQLSPKQKLGKRFELSERCREEWRVTLIPDLLPGSILSTLHSRKFLLLLLCSAQIAFPSLECSRNYFLKRQVSSLFGINFKAVVLYQKKNRQQKKIWPAHMAHAGSGNIVESPQRVLSFLVRHSLPVLCTPLHLFRLRRSLRPKLIPITCATKS